MRGDVRVGRRVFGVFLFLAVADEGGCLGEEGAGG